MSPWSCSAVALLISTMVTVTQKNDFHCNWMQFCKPWNSKIKFSSLLLFCATKYILQLSKIGCNRSCFEALKRLQCVFCNITYEQWLYNSLWSTLVYHWKSLQHMQPLHTHTKSVIYKSEQTAKSSSTSIIIERNAHLLVLYVYVYNITSPFRICVPYAVP